MTTTETPRTTLLNGREFEIVKQTRLKGGMVVRAGEVYGRIGPKLDVLEEQVHTISLHERGFPVSQVLDSGPLDNDYWYFTERSLGDEPFHLTFKSEYSDSKHVSDETFDKYLGVIERYASAQSDANNHTTITAEEFVSSLVPEQDLLHNYAHFGRDLDRYHEALTRVTARLSTAPMGVLQHDLNPYNILEHGVIDFEVVGYGPIGYDTLISARWAGGWFPNYPARQTMAYSLSDQQIAKNDQLIDRAARDVGITEPSTYLQEYLLLKTAWGASEFTPITADLPQDTIDFRHYRTALLDIAVEAYLAGRPIPYTQFSTIKI